MKASERRLLTIFLSLAFMLGVFLLGQFLRNWQHRIERREREAELAQMESTILLAEAPQWMAKQAWLAQAQPVATSDLDANTGLTDMLSQSASAAGLEVLTVQVEGTKPEAYYRQFGVALTVKGEYDLLMPWIYERLTSSPFFVVPYMQITKDPEKPTVIIAKMRVWKWYAPELAAAPVVEPAPDAPDTTPAPSGPDPAPAPGPDNPPSGQL